jgi:hypothetical protein
MHDIFSRQPDPLDELLTPSAPPDVGALRQSAFVRTTAMLRHRRRLRQFAYAAALAASFAAGLFVMRALPRPSLVPDTQPLHANKEESHPPVVEPMPRDESALVQEWIAFDSTDRRGELYRQAGDRYVTEENDLQSALRCYSNSLDNGTEKDLTVSTNDNWLLMAIKNARQKEQSHAKNGG